jgi:hypothetical protein
MPDNLCSIVRAVTFSASFAHTKKNFVQLVQLRLHTQSLGCYYYQNNSPDTTNTTPTQHTLTAFHFYNPMGACLESERASEREREREKAEREREKEAGWGVGGGERERERKTDNACFGGLIWGSRRQEKHASLN